MYIEFVEEGAAADVIYLDFAKAFDKVDHGILLQKLANLGVGGDVLRWIRGFLTNRWQAVKVNSSVSEPAEVVSGVPQGSVLGPLLFLIFVADIDLELQHAKSSSFADDTRILIRIEGMEDEQQMQSDLESIYRWTDLNNMKFNCSKFQHMRYGFTGGDRLETVYYSPDVEPIETCLDLKDLGVRMSCDGKFDLHINERCIKGTQMSGWIFRTFASRKVMPLMTLFKSLVLPIVEYCCQLWSPKQQGLIKRLESVQRQFTSNIPAVSDLTYLQRLKKLQIYSLERRRERYTIMYVWKIIQGSVPNLLGNDGLDLAEYSQRRGRYCKIPSLNNRSSAHVRTLKECSFSVSGPKLFNIMPRNVRDFNGSLHSFKNKLDKYLEVIADEPGVAGGNSLLIQIPLDRARWLSNLGPVT